jgi:PAS domain S-box-containing protein
MERQTFSGNNVLGNMPWGTHFCQFYGIKKDLLEILVPYFKTGLKNNEFCLWIASDPINVKLAARELKKLMPELDDYLKEQRIEILSHEEWYLSGGKFNPERVFNGWNNKLNKALKRGFTGMRVSGNVGWIEHEVSKDFIKYEEGLDHFLIGKRMVVLCTYPLQKCSASDVLNVAHVHDCVISKRSGNWEILEVPEYKKTKEQIQKLNEELEKRVVERTSEVAKANEELKYEIAEHKKAEDALRKSEEKIRLIIDTIPIMAWSMRPDGIVDFLNQRWLDYSGLSLVRYVKDPVGLIHPDDIPRVMEKWKHYMLAEEQHEDEIRLRGADGKYRWFLIRNAPLHDEQGNLIQWYGVSIDIDESKQLNEELRSLSSHLQSIQENERTAIAREIHDELGQQLTALKMEVGWLNRKLPDDIVLKEKVKEILSLISEILKTVKRIAFELRPNILDELGLMAALKWQGQELEKRTGIKFKFHKDMNDFNPDRNISTIIFRVCQEALTNVARHAHASRIETTLEKGNGYIRLIIKDNGKGFDVNAVRNKNSLGLIGMKERALMLRGELTIESKETKGTTITLKAPLPERNKKE